MQAQRLGRPHSYYDVRFPGAQSRDDTVYPVYRNPNVFALRGHTIAYVRKPAIGESEIVVHDLVTGQDLVFCGEAREDITCLTLTDDLLGFASTEGVLYVVDLRDHEPPLRLRLPSAQATALAGDEDTVVALLDCNMIAVYASSTKRLETYSFQPQVEEHYNVALEPAMIMLSIRRGIVDMFSNGNRIEVLAGEDGTDEEALPQLIHHIGHIRFALDGSHLPTRKRLDVKVSSGVELCTEWKVAIGGVHPLGVVDQFHVRLQGLYFNDGDTLWQQERTIVFDAKTALLHLEHHRLVERPCRSQFTGELLLRWKDCYYMLDYLWSVVDTFMEVPDGIDSQENIIGLAGQSSLSLYSVDDDDNDQLHGFAACTNGAFLVVLTGPRTQPCCFGRILVWCFDEEVQMAGGKTTGLWGPERNLNEVEVWERRPGFRLRPARAHVLPFEGGRRTGKDELLVMPPGSRRDEAAWIADE
ncbi:hypothetical protein LTR91_009139 [Friedmanniomyces endolithicus]|uniref:Uncharacterized protein n=1 Tax=Friedmanniomyces endolithicus TaxID=329885 RepID=A0AAN6KLB6_9PEZI|nr:hypothetical protein LTS00_017794 [Friedmanniomyces endolithicus]KAK0286431.1 hypothetical protein LTR35_004866 [Friedmanniomyces endolithicus]KAK0310900.1 hypothetical protein LTR82_014647 [Friedmanniomyces endolithicus]KAK0918138.1 hypothetical protein LTR57_011972 [Friedmanniomyces endolithicus]KAK0989873.1 hypothetical protein LTR91_009139 [Friedmanniomyces endolithicus]